MDSFKSFKSMYGIRFMASLVAEEQYVPNTGQIITGTRIISRHAICICKCKEGNTGLRFQRDLH